MEGDSNYRRQLGKQGEDIACAFLEGLGHQILERNWRSGHLEIDIISLGADGIHFVEVKARRHSIQAPPQDNVDRTKQANIVKAAGRYLRSGKTSLKMSYTEMSQFIHNLQANYIDIPMSIWTKAV